MNDQTTHLEPSADGGTLFLVEPRRGGGGSTVDEVSATLVPNRDHPTGEPLVVVESLIGLLSAAAPDAGNAAVLDGIDPDSGDGWTSLTMPLSAWRALVASVERAAPAAAPGE